MPLIESLAFVLFISFIFSSLAKKLHLSEVVGLIVVGLVISLPFVKQNVVAENQETIFYLAQIGLIFLMFIAGFEISSNLLFKEKKDSLTITIFTVLTSLILGVIVFTLLGYSLKVGLIMGVCFGITAEATKARVLIQLNKLKSRLGAMLMGVGVINDIFGVMALIVITYFFTTKVNWHEFIILVSIILAFFAGMVVHYIFNRFSKGVKTVEKLILYLIVPFFFINLGLNIDIYSIVVDYKILIIVLLTATIGQILGVILTKPITKLSFKQLFLVGWGMNSKGAVELAIAFVALQIGLLPVNLYSSLVITALISTILFQVIIFKMVKKNPRIME
ncbi:MAG: cation:proton antiporter [Patescibacteria group bacterium]